MRSGGAKYTVFFRRGSRDQEQSIRKEGAAEEQSLGVGNINRHWTETKIDSD
jgi:hypothetical protein